jgi:hypothetical protein
MRGPLLDALPVAQQVRPTVFQVVDIALDVRVAFPSSV